MGENSCGEESRVGATMRWTTDRRVVGDDARLPWASSRNASSWIGVGYFGDLRVRLHQCDPLVIVFDIFREVIAFALFRRIVQCGEGILQLYL